MSQPPIDGENADNLEEIEMQFAVKAVQQAETYWSLLEKVPGSKLKLTKHDDQIFEQLLEDFPEFKEKSKAEVIDENEIKSPQGKTKWREFCEKFKDIEDYNFGTLLRLKASDEYGQDTTMFAVRIQFYAIEIARNKYGLNDWICKSEQSN
ncbi:YPL225W [Candida pseudojiufengensis]|uniref:YPL225W n=1 Tax=Candida pseudojiufengensis TaxID=497109 RepID=UPI0022244A47|nr:YPL225W [Candida pseudojiufengensis]KAI5959298.1 YPL225W [Candida pseudojiufengensis]